METPEQHGNRNEETRGLINWLKKHLLTVLMGCGLVIGIGLLLYPSVANYWNTMHQAKSIMDYTGAVTQMDTEDYSEILENAREYNKRLGETGIRWNMTEEQRRDYQSQLKIEGSNVMGYISIPKIHVKLPIYHGTDEDVLQDAIGHLEETSLPVGGENSHSCVSGHRGLPSAKLFTDLDKLKEGDTWTQTILNETLTYEVDQILTVEPNDLRKLRIEDKKDQATLITCTPYAVNTHRLLVRGHRVPNANGDAKLTADAIQIEPIYIVPFLAMPMILALLVLLIVSTRQAAKTGAGSYADAYLKARGPAGNMMKKDLMRDRMKK